MSFRYSLHPILWFIGLPLAIAGFFVSMQLLSIFVIDRRPATDYFLPEGFKGWARVDYEVRGSPRLLSVNGRYVLRLGSNGRVKTSDHLAYGWASDKYYYESQGSRQVLNSSGSTDETMIWGEKFGRQYGAYQCFFVGTKQEYAAQMARNPCP